MAYRQRDILTIRPPGCSQPARAPDTELLPGRVRLATVAIWAHNRYHFKRGDPVIIVSGRYKGCTGLVDSAVFQRTMEYPDEYAAGYHVILDDGTVVTVRVEQVESH